MGEFKARGRRNDVGIGSHILDLRLRLAFLASDGSHFALAANLGRLEFSDGVLVNLLGRIRQGFVKRHERHLHVAVHEHGGHAEVLGVGHETILTR